MFYFVAREVRDMPDDLLIFRCLFLIDGALRDIDSFDARFDVDKRQYSDYDALLI